MSLLTRAEAAKLCRCSLPAFDEHVRPRLPVLRVGRRVLFRRDDLEAWMAAPAEGKAAQPRAVAVAVQQRTHAERLAVRHMLTRGQRVRLGVATPDEVEIEAALAEQRAGRRKRRERAG